MFRYSEMKDHGPYETHWRVENITAW